MMLTFIVKENSLIVNLNVKKYSKIFSPKTNPNHQLHKSTKICTNHTTNVCGIATIDSIEDIKTTGKDNKMISLKISYDQSINHIIINNSMI